MEKEIYEIELSSRYPEWWRYNLYISAIEFDRHDTRIGYRNVVDRVYEIEDGAGRDIRHAPQDWGGGSGERKLMLTTDPCDHISIYIYVIANTFPESAHIRDSPPFPAELTVRRVSKKSEATGVRSGKSAPGDSTREIFRQTYDVNQWGGLTIAGLRIDDPDGIK